MSNTPKLRVAVIGSSGYGGAELARILAIHPRAELVLATASGERAGVPLSDLFPHLRGICDLPCEELNLDEIAQRADFVFIALGHGKAMELVPPLLERGLKVCDLGADFRLRDAGTYEQWYKLPHTATTALKNAVYGLPEWNRAKIKSAQLVANPGCYPTSAILPLAPFVAAQFIDETSIIVDAASGTSGAGRSSFGIGMHHPELHSDYRAYNIASHRHTPEIEQALVDAKDNGNISPDFIHADFLEELDDKEAERILHEMDNKSHEDLGIAITFTAHLLPIARGILTTSYATLKSELDTAAAQQVLSEYYKNEPFVRVHKTGETPQIKHVVGSNFCDIGVVVDERVSRLILISAEDNLIKGAAGQAIQNMNIMCDFPETDGLNFAPLFP